MTKTKAKPTKKRAPRNRISAMEKNGTNPVTSVPISEKQSQILQQANMAVQAAQGQQEIAIAAIVAGHDMDASDVDRNLRLSEDGTRLEWGAMPAPVGAPMGGPQPVE